MQFWLGAIRFEHILAFLLYFSLKSTFLGQFDIHLKWMSNWTKKVDFRLKYNKKSQSVLETYSAEPKLH